MIAVLFWCFVIGLSLELLIKSFVRSAHREKKRLQERDADVTKWR
jgi:hypothetical protein